jgi:hypothetical protein
MCVCGEEGEEDGRRTGGGREEEGGADTGLKSKTPHVNVGKIIR